MKLKIKITFGKTNKIIGWYGECIKIRLKAKPEKGKANKEIISFLSEELGIPKNQITLESGHTSGTKLISLPGQAYEILLGLAR